MGSSSSIAKISSGVEYSYKQKQNTIIYVFLGDFKARGLPSGRIVGGVATTIEKHPWQVSIQVFGNHICGGSIIKSDIILTAAHCITE